MELEVRFKMFVDMDATDNTEDEMEKFIYDQLDSASVSVYDIEIKLEGDDVEDDDDGS